VAGGQEGPGKGGAHRAETENGDRSLHGSRLAA
jgi:hypothetical protein